VEGPALYLSAFCAALAISTVATPAGVSGALLLLPFQVSVLGTPRPSVTPTNLLYNVVATPGALYRYWRQGQTGGRLTALLLAGTIPGVVAGSVIRVELLPGPEAFEIVIAVVLIPLGSWLATTAPTAHARPTHPTNPRPDRHGHRRPLCLLCRLFECLWRHSPRVSEKATGSAHCRCIAEIRRALTMCPTAAYGE
jgi:uncharacterized membrane protein YfcA